MEQLSKAPEEISLLETIENAFKVLNGLPLQLDLWKAQNIYFSLGKERCDEMEEKAAQGDQFARKWLDSFYRLGDSLHIKSSSCAFQ